MGGRMREKGGGENKETKGGRGEMRVSERRSIKGGKRENKGITTKGGG